MNTTVTRRGLVSAAATAGILAACGYTGSTVCGTSPAQAHAAEAPRTPAAPTSSSAARAARASTPPTAPSSWAPM